MIDFMEWIDSKSYYMNWFYGFILRIDSLDWFYRFIQFNTNSKCTLSLKDNFNIIIKNLQNAKKSWRVENILIYSLESKNVENL